MHNFIINSSIKKFKSYDLDQKEQVLLLDFLLKENCSDIRNSKFLIYTQILKEKSINLMYDPYVDKNEVLKTYNFKIINTLKKNYSMQYILLSHTKFKNMGYKNSIFWKEKMCSI